MDKCHSRPIKSSHVYDEIMRQREHDLKAYKSLFTADKTRVKLVQVQQTEKAAAKLHVRNGRFNDPLNEIAHRCEQMLFKGSCIFPKLPESTDFSTEHG